MYFVYILQSEKDKTFYTGTTTKLKDRIQQRNWHETQSTSSKTPYTLKWFCGFGNKEKAYAFEKYLKSSSGFAFRTKHFV